LSIIVFRDCFVAFPLADILKNGVLTEQLIRRTPFLYGQIGRFFDRMEAAGADERMHLLSRRLAPILKAAAQTPHYRQLGLPLDLAAWPYLTKEQVRDAGQSLATPGIVPPAPAATGGSTGMPLRLKRSWRAVVAEQVALDRLAEKAGAHFPAARIAVLRGDTVKDPNDSSPPFWVLRAGGRRMVLSSNHLRPQTAGTFVDALRAFAPEIITAYPSALEAFCGLIGGGGRKPVPSLRLVIASSEVLRPDVRARAASTLGVPVFDHYGQAERVNLATSETEGSFVFSGGYGVNELIYSHSDEETDYYEIVGTSLWNRAQFLIRYRTGDLAALPKGSSETQVWETALGLRPFLGVAGRASEYIETPAGVHVIGINQIPRGLEGVLQMQLVQRARDRVEIHVVPQHDLPESLREQIIRQARTKIPDTVALDLCVVDAVQRTAAGKAPLVIREVA
jgi:phenylacetate-CoA ligase